MRVFPLSVPMHGTRIALVGEGGLAARKLVLLARTPADVTVFAPLPGPELEAQLAGSLSHPEFCLTHARSWPDTTALRGFALVFVAIEDHDTATDLARHARAAGSFVNVVDRPDLSDFHVPAIVERGEVVVAIATGGLAPSLARFVRAKVEAALPAGLGFLAELARRLDQVLRKALPLARDRRLFWEKLLHGPVAERAQAGDVAGAEGDARAMLAAGDSDAPGGMVHIVGAGPGDPDLLTLRALRLLQAADVVVHDRLVDPRILDLARRDADFIYAGKRAQAHSRNQTAVNQTAVNHTSMSQAAINALLIAKARAGLRVVRLKGGDPFIFGRGGEEMDALRAAGIPVSVVPGITAALACAASAGTALTHRDYAHSVTFLTGHWCGHAAGAGEEPQAMTLPPIDGSVPGAHGQTLVIYMGALQVEGLVARLLAAGHASATPVLAVENGARPDERRLWTTLAELAADLGRFVQGGPVLLIIGEAARQRADIGDRAIQRDSFALMPAHADVLR